MCMITVSYIRFTRRLGAREKGITTSRFRRLRLSVKSEPPALSRKRWHEDFSIFGFLFRGHDLTEGVTDDFGGSLGLSGGDAEGRAGADRLRTRKLDEKAASFQDPRDIPGTAQTGIDLQKHHIR